MDNYPIWTCSIWLLDFLPKKDYVLWFKVFMSFFGGDCVHDLLFQLISKGLKISEGNYLLGLQSFKGEEAWDWYICIFCQLLIYPLHWLKLNTKTQNIFCRLNENLTTFLYTLTGATRKQKEKKKCSLLKCIQ